MSDLEQIEPKSENYELFEKQLSLIQSIVNTMKKMN